MSEQFESSVRTELDDESSIRMEDEAELDAWLPANFRDGPALVKSYRELQAEQTRTWQALAELRRVNAELMQVFEALEEQPVDGYDVPTNGQPQVSPEALAAFIEQQTAAYIQAGLQQQQVPVPQGPSAEDVALAEARAREAEAQLEQQRLMKLSAQSMGGSGGRPEPAADDDQAFAKSLLEIHQSGYAGQMQKRGN